MERSVCAQSNENSKPIPITRQQPAYPIFAKSASVEGWVVLNFTVKADGKTSEVLVANSHPKNIFDAAAIDSVKSYRFCKSDDGFAKQEILIRFEMSD